MTWRERIAWCGFAVSAVALAAALTLRDGRPPAAATSPSPCEDARLARMDERLARMEHSLLPRSGDESATARADPPPGPTRDTATAAAENELEPGPAAESRQEESSERNRLAATALVEHAIGTGYWSRRDTEAWRAAVRGIRVEDRFELQRRLIGEMNADRLKVEPGAGPF